MKLSRANLTLTRVATGLLFGSVLAVMVARYMPRDPLWIAFISFGLVVLVVNAKSKNGTIYHQTTVMSACLPLWYSRLAVGYNFSTATLALLIFLAVLSLLQGVEAFIKDYPENPIVKSIRQSKFMTFLGKEIKF